MRARAKVVADVDSLGRTRLHRVRSDPPIVLRETAGALYLVGGAAGPLGGDDLGLDIEVRGGATLRIRSAAASVALPGERPSLMQVTVRVAAGAWLDWAPEPLVAARGCCHLVESEVVLAAGAGLRWREEIVMGRHKEQPGSVRTRLAAEIDGTPLLRQEVALGPAYRGSDAVTGAARALGSVLLVDPGWTGAAAPAIVLSALAVALPLDGPGVQIMALAEDSMALRRDLDAGEVVVGSRAVTPGGRVG